jgi:hypothetical protein
MAKPAANWQDISSKGELAKLRVVNLRRILAKLHLPNMGLRAEMLASIEKAKAKAKSSSQPGRSPKLPEAEPAKGGACGRAKELFQATEPEAGPLRPPHRMVCWAVLMKILRTIKSDQDT